MELGINKLDKWIIEHGMTNEHFGQLCNVSSVTVSRWRNERHFPLPLAMKRIIKVTKGEISPNDFYERHDEYGPAKY